MNFIKIIIFILYLLLKQNFRSAQFSRLLTDIQPIHYELFLTPNLENFTYIGKQNVFINVQNTTKNVVLNSLNINIKNVTYSNENKNALNSQSIEYNTEQETVIITFKKELPLGKDGFLSFEFKGEINEKLHGFYRSTYTSNGVTKFAVVTQFAPTDARRCFPCWDEPGIKATFEINLTTSKDLVSISNMPIKSMNITEPDLITTSFDKTPLMSTYLVAFIICDYDFIENHVNNKTVRVYAPQDKIQQGKYSLDIATKALRFFESYFNIPYPLLKLDLITVADFSFGVMENWGLITYREAILLFYCKNSSIDKKQRGALTVAHELAHQWFGNLVTMEWWTDLWLNEGYASFMQYLCIDSIHPEYNIWTHFFTTKYLKAIELDALANTHPIEVLIENPSEITEIFDQISYNKGASIIRMIYSYIGDDDFRKGMHLYLSRHSYSNVKTEDLWSALEEVNNKPIGHIMSSWTKLPGFPLILVTENDTNNSKNRIFTFSQERFYINGSSDKSDIIWVIPITISSALDPTKILKTIILDEKIKTVEIEGVTKENWIKINSESVGFFRTVYSSKLLKMLMIAIEEQKLPALDRLGLLDDSFATTQAGRASTVEFLKLLSKFKNETDYTVWSSIISNLRKINNILLNSKNINLNFKKFGRNILYNIYSKLGWTVTENENHLDKLLRNMVLSQMVEFGDENVISEAQHRFQKHIINQTILSADFRSFVYQAVLSVGNKEVFENMLLLYRETDMAEERNRILSSLGAIKDRSLLQRVLEFSMSEEVKTQDSYQAIQSVTKSHEGQFLAWQYFKDNWETFVNRYQSGNLLTNIVQIVTKNIVMEEIIQDIKEFFEKNPISGTQRTVQQSIETITLNVAWLKRDKKSVEAFLNSQ